MIFLCKNPTKQPCKFLHVLKQQVAILMPCFPLPLFVLGSQPGTLFAAFLLANPSLMRPSPPPGRPPSALPWTGLGAPYLAHTARCCGSCHTSLASCFFSCSETVLFRRGDCLLYSCVPAAQHRVQNTVSSQALFVLNG